MQWSGCHGEERHGGDRLWRMQWTGCHDEERHGGDRGCEGGCNGQGVMMRRDMEVTEVEEDAMDRVSW